MVKLNVEKRINRNFFLGFVFYILVFLLISPCFSQNKKDKPTEQEPKTSYIDKEKVELLRWQNLSEQITKDILADTKSGVYSERPIVLAKLAALWWKTDNKMARQWLKTAVSEVSFDSLVETDIEKERRLKTAEKLVKFIIPLDRQLAENLIENLSKKSDQTKSNQLNADELVNTALQIVESNPVLAKNLGSLSLKNGQSYSIFRLIRELNLKDEKLSESLFNESLLAAEAFPNLETSVGFVSALSTVAFNPYKGKSLSEDARKNFLTVLFNLISAENASPAYQKQSCNFNLTATRFISSYQTYFPEKAIAVKQKSVLCEKVSGNSAGLTSSDSNENQPQTAEEYLEAAKETKNNLQKKNYYYRAIEKLYQTQKYEKIISVLDGMDEEDRKAFSEDSWNSWRWESALKASVEFVKQKNFSGAYRVINNTPQTLRPIVQSGLAREIESEDKPFAVSLLDDARKGLTSFDIKPKDKAGLLLFLTRQYSEIAPYEAASVFRQAVKAVNDSDEANPENNPVKDYAPLKETVSIPFFLLETEELATLEIVSGIKSPNSRIRFRLGLLEQSLKKLDELNKKLEKQDTESKSVR